MGAVAYSRAIGRAALSALTGEREIDFGLRTRCSAALHCPSSALAFRRRSRTVPLHAGTPAFQGRLRRAIGASLEAVPQLLGTGTGTGTGTVLQNIHPHGCPLLPPRHGGALLAASAERLEPLTCPAAETRPRRVLCTLSSFPARPARASQTLAVLQHLPPALGKWQLLMFPDSVSHYARIWLLLIKGLQIASPDFLKRRTGLSPQSCSKGAVTELLSEL